MPLFCNNITICGQIGQFGMKDLVSGNGTRGFKFDVGVKRSFPNKELGPNGEKSYKWDNFHVTIWGKTAEYAISISPKPKDIVLVTGSLEINDYIDAQGVKKYNIDINAKDVKFNNTFSDNGSAFNGQQNGGNFQQQQPPPQNNNGGNFQQQPPLQNSYQAPPQNNYPPAQPSQNNNYQQPPAQPSQNNNYQQPPAQPASGFDSPQPQPSSFGGNKGGQFNQPTNF